MATRATPAERSKIGELKKRFTPEIGLAVVSKEGRRLYQRECTGTEPRYAYVLYLDPTATDWWPRDRVPKRPHEIRRDS